MPFALRDYFEAGFAHRAVDGTGVSLPGVISTTLVEHVLDNGVGAIDARPALTDCARRAAEVVGIVGS
jgi:hypothetical protein